MGLLSSKKRSGCRTGCIIMKWLIALLLFIVTVAALLGVYATHVLNLPGGVGLQFGSTSGSLAILAFVASVTVWVKHMIRLGKPCEVCK